MFGRKQREEEEARRRKEEERIKYERGSVELGELMDRSECVEVFVAEINKLIAEEVKKEQERVRSRQLFEIHRFAGYCIEVDFKDIKLGNYVRIDYVTHGYLPLNSFAESRALCWALSKRLPLYRRDGQSNPSLYLTEEGKAYYQNLIGQTLKPMY